MAYYCGFLMSYCRHLNLHSMISFTVNINTRNKNKVSKRASEISFFANKIKTNRKVSQIFTLPFQHAFSHALAHVQDEYYYCLFINARNFPLTKNCTLFFHNISLRMNLDSDMLRSWLIAGVMPHLSSHAQTIESIEKDCTTIFSYKNKTTTPVLN